MDSKAYNSFTDALVRNLTRDERVLGLVAVGSMAGTHNQPDQWSDHDFLVITEPGAEEEFRASTEWLPQYRPIVLHFGETKHGVKVVYNDGHLLEYAIFNSDDFKVVKINSYRILIDRGGFKALVEQAVVKTPPAEGQPPDEFLFGQFLAHLLVGTGRYARGEQLSGAQFVKQFALTDLLQMIRRHIVPDNPNALDNIDPMRRLDLAYPRLGAQLNSAVSLATPQAASALLDLAECEVFSKLPAYSVDAVAAVRKIIETATI